MYRAYLLLLVLCVAGCSGSRSPLRTGPPPFVGSWVGQVGFFPAAFTFGADGSYSAGTVGGRVGTGHWTESDGQVLLRFDEPPTEDQADRAEWSITDDGRTLTLKFSRGGKDPHMVILQRSSTR